MSAPQASDASYIMSQAIFHNNITLLEELLENGADPNFPNSYGDCPLHEAAQYGQRECVSVLLSYKAGVNSLGSGGKTPLHKAVTGVNAQVRAGGEDAERVVHENQLDIVRLLVAHGADLSITDESGLTARDLAMQCDFYKCADLLDELKEIMKKESEDRLRKSREQGVFSACKDGNLTEVKNILPYVPEVINEIMNEEGDNLLMCAARYGHVDIVEYLLDKGSVAMASPITDMTALHLASRGGHGDVVVCLLNKLPALLMIDDSPKETSLHIAARMGHVEIVKNLLTVAACTERLKHRSISTSDESGESERSFLCGESLRVPMNEALPEMIIDVMTVTVNEHKTALHEAAITGNVEIVKLLVDFMREFLTHDTLTSNAMTFSGPIVGGFSPLQSEGASTPTLRSSGFPTKNSPSSRKAYAVPGIDMMTLKGRTAFHEAAKQGHFEVMKILLQAGADINAFMRPSLDFGVNVELTALVQACLMQRLDVIKFLLQNGATDARLKALSRSLKIPYDEAAGLLLCYNGGLSEIVDVRKPTPEMFGSQPIANLNVSWNSKNLTYVRKEWLELAITEFPNPTAKYCVISELDISSNNLTSLPIEIFSLPYLKQLDFNRNKVTQFPHMPEKPCGGWSCPKLGSIDAANNQLSAIPSCLFHLPELRELLATGNKISDVPVCVWTAPKLQRLYLSKNCLESFPTAYEEGANGCTPAFFASTSEGSPMSPYSITSPDTLSNLDSGYRSHPKGDLADSINVKYNSPTFAFPKPGTPLKSHRSLEIKSNTIQTQSVISRRLENFQDDNVEVDELEDTEGTAEDGSSKKSFMLEALDLSHNKLTTLPTGLSCLAPRLTKLNVSHNQIKSLGTVSDFPYELEYLEASSNELHTAIAPSLAGADLRYYQPCARKVLGLAVNGLTSSVNSSDTPKSFLYKPCNHRIHKNLRKLSTVKFNKNFLVDLQLFRMPARSGSRGEFGTSVEESMRTKRTGTIGPEMVASNILPKLNEVVVSKNSSSLGERRSQTMGRKIELAKKNSNEVSPSHPVDKKSSKESSGDPDKAASLGSSNSSQDEQSSSPSVVASPLFPQLTTLELAHNRLKNVPANIHLIANLSTLSISHNTEIDTLPLELSNLEHLWSLEYEGCPLTNPPYQDLDKFRLASDKLLYMRSLLHDAKQNESMKLMMVGFQKMGKTTILGRLCESHERVTPSTTFLQRITGEEATPPTRSKGKRTAPLSTVGVDLGIWKYRKDLEPEFLKQKKKGAKQLRSVTFYTWDFGGQEEYYVTHQCFLSSRSLYLAVWNITHGEKGIDDLGPWLHNIQARAPGSPVVIVGTHCDKLKVEERERRKIELSDIITQKYLVGRGPQQLREMGLPKILGVYYVSCPTSGHTEGITKLRMALYDIAFSLYAPGKAGVGSSKTKLLEQPIPASYLKLEERVRQLAVQSKDDSTPPVVKETVFRDSTKDIIANARELNQAVTFLHENGIMLHYDTPALSHLYFVDPQWLCDMLAHIVTVPEVNRFIQRTEGPEAGILRTTILSHVFKGNVFPQAHRKEYIELLSKFEVALYLDRHRLLVPSMLPVRPAYTLHFFDNVFPRPSLKQILAHSPETSRLFGALSSGKVDPNAGKPSQLAVATHVSEELFRTGLILRRFYFMTYVPSGFWPRLVSRFLASAKFTGVVLQSLGYSEEQIKDISDQIISGQLGGAVSLEWSYWKTGIELWYKGLSLIRLTEVMPGGNFQDCKSSPSIFEQSSSNPVEPAFDTQDLSFELCGGWMPVEMTPSRGVEILVPDTVCLAALQKDVQAMLSCSPSQFMGTPEPRGDSSSSSSKYPQYESHWMSAEILSMAVDFIDTLLEDWYPGLGLRDGSKTAESIPYVNRVVPCPFCVSGASSLPPDKDKAQGDEVCELPSHSTPPTSTKQSKRGHRIRIKLKRSSKSRDSIDSTSSQNQLDPPPKAKRNLFNIGSIGSSRSSSTNSWKAGDSVTVNGDIASPRSPSLPMSTSGSSLPSVDEPPPPTSPHPDVKLTRKESLAHVFQEKLGTDEAEDNEIATVESPVLKSIESLNHGSSGELSLMQASKFGFMIETCILAARNDECLVCPAHKEHPLIIRDIAPDLIFADLPSGYILDPRCVDKGKYVTEGAFGEIYRGAVYPSPSATDDEGREVAIKIDHMDSKFSANPDSATKAYMEVRAEVSILSHLNHPNVIEFVGVVLHPLCFILEWAPGGSLKSIIEKYRKVDARISPMALQNTAYQVASGLAYLHEYKIVYYDLKSPNVLVFKFPSAQESLQATQAGPDLTPADSQPTFQQQGSVHIKIADMGISQTMTPGGVMGFKGSPGFMAPEILKYVGLEACTEKVDIFSYAMFLYEMISLYFPFEKQNLMKAQIEKLVTEEERPPLQSRELNNPILFLDVMRWCWQQDFRNRPSAVQLTELLTNPSISRLVDAMNLHHSSEITCACTCTLPIELLPPADLEGGSVLPPASSPHLHVTRGDLQEELWLCTYTANSAEVVVINFKDKVAQSFPVESQKITSLCCVINYMWLGTEEGKLFVYDAINKNTLINRQLTSTPGQGIVAIYHQLTLRQVIMIRRDGCILIFNDAIQERMIPDNTHFDNKVNSTLLPVRAVFKTPEKLPVLCSLVTSTSGENKATLWCGTKNEMMLLFDILNSQITYCRKLYNRSRYETSPEFRVTALASSEMDDKTAYVWALTEPNNILVCWDAKKEERLSKIDVEQFTVDRVTSLHAMGSQLQLALDTGKILLLNTCKTEITATVVLHGHGKEIHQMMSIGGRILPRHWLPSIIGRSNTIDFYKDLVDEQDAKSIRDSMFGRQTRLLVTIGHGYHGLAERIVEPLMSPRDRQDNFVLLWAIGNNS